MRIHSVREEFQVLARGRLTQNATHLLHPMGCSSRGNSDTGTIVKIRRSVFPGLISSTSGEAKYWMLFRKLVTINVMACAVLV